jgi:G3E family GTPase
MVSISRPGLKPEDQSRIKNTVLMTTGIETVPRVVLICGFLGSGKSTLLQRLLEWEQAQGTHPEVIMSEFGDIDIDGILVKNDRCRLTTITGGCSCCDLRDELAEAVGAALLRKPGRIYLEATGVADPAGMLEAISPVTHAGAAVTGRVIVVYDASRHHRQGEDSTLILRQLSAADIIIVNKCDAVTPGERGRIVGEMRKINPAAQVLTAVNCAVDIESVLEGARSAQPASLAGPTSGRFRSFAFMVEEPLSETALKKWLLSLPKSVVRVKGFVRLAGRSGYSEVQATPGRHIITPFMGYPEEQGVLVLIAHPMRADGLVRRLQECIAR